MEETRCCAYSGDRHPEVNRKLESFSLYAPIATVFAYSEQFWQDQTKQAPF